MADKAKIDGARQVLLKDVEFHYYKEKPVMYKGRLQWEVSLSTKEPKQAEEWEFNHLKVRGNGTSTTVPTEWKVSLNRKCETNSGDAQEPVRIVDENLKAYTPEERKKIGNESRGNVILWQGEYDNQHGQGVSTSLTAMQIPRDKVKWYEGSMDTVDFDNLGGGSTGDGQEADVGDLF